jgi:hypothetical protein
MKGHKLVHRAFKNKKHLKKHRRESDHLANGDATDD